VPRQWWLRFWCRTHQAAGRLNEPDSTMTTREWVVAGFIVLMLSLGAIVGLFVIV
jgi:hypothetical protein